VATNTKLFLRELFFFVPPPPQQPLSDSIPLSFLVWQLILEYLFWLEVLVDNKIRTQFEFLSNIQDQKLKIKNT
jgi:hypothetical protein